MGKRLNKVKAFGKKHWKGIVIGCGVAAVAIVGRKKIEPITGRIIRIADDDDLQGYGIHTVTEYDDSYELYTEDRSGNYYPVHIDDLGFLGKSILETLPGVTHLSDCAVMVEVMKTKV